MNTREEYPSGSGLFIVGPVSGIYFVEDAAGRSWSSPLFSRADAERKAERFAEEAPVGRSEADAPKLF